MIICFKCKLEKPVTEFSKNKARASGLSHICRDCEREKNKVTYAKNAEKRRAYATAQRDDPEKKTNKAEYQHRYHEEHKDALNAYSKEWRKTNTVNRSEASKERARIYARNKYASSLEIRSKLAETNRRYRRKTGREELNRKQREWHKANPGKACEYYVRHRIKVGKEVIREKDKENRQRYKIQRQAGNAAYYARRYGSSGIISNEHLYALHKWQDHCCFYCHEYLDSHETIEHIVPLSRNGTNNPWNVVLVCEKCNLSKNNKIYAIEWEPDKVLSTPRFHSIHGTNQLRILLEKENIIVSVFPDHLQVGDRKIFVLSSFWLAWDGVRTIYDLKEKYPKALLLFDKEIEKHRTAIVNMIKAKAFTAKSIGARQLEVTIPSVQEAHDFMATWHAMGSANATHYLGLRDNNEWWAIAAFKRNGNFYENVRMTFKNLVQGGPSRIVKHFIEMMPEKLPIVAFTDQRHGDGASHYPSGYRFEGITYRTLFYATPEIDGFYPRRAFQRIELAKRGEFYDPCKSQIQNAKANGLMRVDGLPLLRFVLDI